MKEIMNGKGTTLYIDENDYISIHKDGKDITLRGGGLVLAFNTFDDLVKAIDCSKATWIERIEEAK